MIQLWNGSKLHFVIPVALRQKRSDRHDERNVARLSLVLAAKRIPPTMQYWVKEFPSQNEIGTSMLIECRAGHGNVVPHGTDNDVLLGIINSYIAAGMPEDGVITSTAYQLLQLSSLHDSGKRYKTLEASLTRLQATTFRIVDSWFDNQQARYRSVTTSLIAKFKVDDADTNPDLLGSIRGESVLEITLDSDLASSIRSGFIRPLDPEILQRLTQPLARVLYRLLCEQHHPLGGAPVEVYQVSVMALAKHLGLLDDRAYRVRRALEPAHEQILATGFLRTVEYTGRGETQEVTYVFSKDALPPADPTSVSDLIHQGVSQPVAMQLTAQYGKDHVRKQLGAFEELLGNGYRARNRAALLVDLIRSPEKYPLPEGETPAPAGARKPPAASPGPETGEEPPLDPRDTVRSLLRVRLGRSASEAALKGLEKASAEELTFLKALLTEHGSNLELAESVLGAKL